MDESTEMQVAQAYRSMFYFLESLYQVDRSDYLGTLLGALSWNIWNDGAPGDPAYWNQWCAAFKKASEDGLDLPVSPKR